MSSGSHFIPFWSQLSVSGSRFLALCVYSGPVAVEFWHLRVECRPLKVDFGPSGSILGLKKFDFRESRVNFESKGVTFWPLGADFGGLEVDFVL